MSIPTRRIVNPSFHVPTARKAIDGAGAKILDWDSPVHFLSFIFMTGFRCFFCCPASPRSKPLLSHPHNYFIRHFFWFLRRVWSCQIFLAVFVKWLSAIPARTTQHLHKDQPNKPRCDKPAAWARLVLLNTKHRQLTTTTTKKTHHIRQQKTRSKSA